MSDVAYVGNRISTLDVSRQFDSYSKVIIHVSDDEVIEVGTDAGRTLELDNPYGTQQMAQDILTRLQGYQYQPYQADGTIINPAAEIGDALSSTKVYGGIYTRSNTFGRLMKADVGAPYDEEINHEYAFETPEQREFKRQIDDVRASLVIANNNINAKVSQTGGDPSSFGWTLTASGFQLYSNGQTVMTVDSSGLTVAGNVGAVTGEIGGFTIGATAIYKNIPSMTSTQSTGVYLGTDGIKLGQNFSVNSSGNVSANNMVLSGTLNMGGVSISAADLANRANNGNSAYNWTSSNGGYCTGGVGNWYGAKGGFGYASDIYAGSFHSSSTSYFAEVRAYRFIHYSTGNAYNKYMDVVTGISVSKTYFGQLGNSVVMNVTPTKTRIYYWGA